MNIKSDSYSKCFNELPLGICRSNRNGKILVIAVLKNLIKQFQSVLRKILKNSGQYDAMKLLIKAISVIILAKALSYHLRHHSVCLYKILHENLYK